MTKRRISTNLDIASKEEGTFSVFKDKELHYTSWKPKQSSQSKWALILIHGMGDHSGHMMTIVEYFLKKHDDSVIYAYDQRGHGLTQGTRGHIDSWTQFRGDLEAFCEFVQKKESVETIILFGNSMGGAVVLDFSMHMANKAVKAVMANGPALGMHDLGAVLGTVVSLISKVSPAMNNSAALQSAKLTRDPQKQQENDEDELVHTNCSMKLLSELRNTGNYIKSHPEDLKLPVLIVAGEEDPIAITKESKKFIAQVQKTNNNADIHITPGGMHETFNDTDREDVFQRMEQFVNSVLEGTSNNNENSNKQ
mmetsp:Transcript_10678/g.14630  ORF Transcript_10678/g.14630 Transcript_10678/m.14630 type:complete len:309 (+) Transcript_10678:41-967(+)